MPSDILVTSAPASLQFNLPFDFTASTIVGGTGFTVSDGVITGGSIFMQDPSNSLIAPPFILGINSDLNDLENENLPGNPSVVNISGLSGVTFTAVPEPKSVFLALTAGAVLVALRRRTSTV